MSNAPPKINPASDAGRAMLSMGLDPLNPDDVVKAAKRARELKARIARDNPNMFCRYVLRDEKTNRPIEQAPMHERWHALLNDHDRLVMWSHVEGGKTTQIAIGRTLFELGRDPMLRICVVSNTADLAKKMTRLVGQYIQKSDELHEVFPHLVPTDDPQLPWKAQALTIKRPGALGGKDPSIQATGVHGNVIGSRIDLLVLDDILDHENTHTPGPRDDVYRWIKSTLMSRLTENARVWIVGNAWHPDDAMHRLEKDGFIAHRFPVILPDGTITWPAKWPKERIERAKGPDGLGPLEFARQLMCQARDDTSARFKRDWIDACVKAGEGLPYCNTIADLHAELYGHETPEEREAREQATKAAESIWRLGGDVTATPGVITGVDLAVRRADSADWTVLFTIYVDAKGNRRVLNVRAGKWAGPEIIAQVKKVYEDFGGIIIVENNAAQQYIVDIIREETAIPVVPFTTGKNKAHHEFGVESLATEMANGKWHIPNKARTQDATGRVRYEEMHPEIKEWITELLFYDPKEHTGDRVMASWFAREGARKFVDGQAEAVVGLRTF